MCWCPITSLDTADEAYEWAMGQYTTDGTRGSGTWTGALSDDLASAYANYINDLGLRLGLVRYPMIWLVHMPITLMI